MIAGILIGLVAGTFFGVLVMALAKTSGYEVGYRDGIERGVDAALIQCQDVIDETHETCLDAVARFIGNLDPVPPSDEVRAEEES